jgi:RNA polymerase sigma-70 factor (ECF subfamily)
VALGQPFESSLAAAQTGAGWALASLYSDLQPPLLRYLLAQEPGEGEDLASQVWLDVGRAIAGFQGDESAFRCWIFTIARRRVLDLRRRRARRRTNPVPIERLANRPDPLNQVDAVEEGQALAQLAALPTEWAEIVLLRVVAGLDSNEVARVTGKKPGTVRVIQKRALERLAELIARETEDLVTR